VGSADSLIVALNDKNGTFGKFFRNDSIYVHVAGMAAAADSLLRALSSGKGLAGQLLTDQTLYDRVNKLTSDLEAILADVRKDPRRFTKGLICVFRCK
jgi:phospholipid/cholesterol/gamma-HCH transport system substrate-binding protein